MKLTNEQIYNYSNSLLQLCQNKEMLLPLKVNFYLQKNKNTLVTLAQDIEQHRLAILQQYGEIAENGEISFLPDKAAKAQADLSELFGIEQEVQIYIVSIENFTDDMVLSTEQMEAMMFMIEP